MHDFLNKILDSKKEIVQHKMTILPISQLKDMILQRTFDKRNFKSAISKSNKLCVIGELKKASPSAGIIREEFNITQLAIEFEKSSVDALSILTEEKYFLGDLYYLLNVREVVNLPILRKDFIIDEYQIYESCAYGADAVLLISEILSKEQLKDYVELSKNLGLDPIVEFHNESEIEKVIDSQAEIIGINNRNLKDFTVDLSTTLKFRQKIPNRKIIVSESGIKSKADIVKLKDAKINALLIGEVLMRTENIKEKLIELGLYDKS